MEEEILNVERELDAITSKLGYMHCSEPLSKRRGMEARYGRVYQQLVRLGVRPQIRLKYR